MPKVTPLFGQIAPIALMLAGLASPAAAQDAGTQDTAGQNADAKSAQMVKSTGEYFGITQTRSGCGSADSAPGEVVVCGRPAPDQKVERTDPSGKPDSKMTALGTPPTGAVGGGVVTHMCFLQKCPKELLFIDLKALPQAPAGSDADLIAKGEMRAP